MSANNVNDRRSDELDLMELLKKFISFLRSSAIYIFGFGLIGLAAGIILYSISPYQYTSKLVLHSYFLTNQEHIQTINGWNDLLKNKEHAVLAEIMNCEPAVIGKLSKITAEEIVKANPDGNLNGFYVSVLVKDTAILNELQDGIKYGLENSDYVKARLAVKRENLNTLIKKVSDEVRKLDSVKSNVEKVLTNTGGKSSSSFLIDVGDINIEIVTLSEKLLTYQEELRFLGAVHILQNFNKLKRPVEPKKRTLFPLGLITGMSIGYVVYLWVYLRRKLRYAPTKQN